MEKERTGHPIEKILGEQTNCLNKQAIQVFGIEFIKNRYLDTGNEQYKACLKKLNVKYTVDYNE